VPGGLLVQQSESPLALMQLDPGHAAAMTMAGFSFRTLPFPQPCYPTGWWSCLIASKQSRDLASFRKADATAKPFDTQYYTAEVHQGALAMPPLLQRALAD
jgi:spermidine synthase